MQKPTRRNIVLAGGHAATTALAVIEELAHDRLVLWNIAWIGPDRAIEGAKIRPFELELFPKLGVKVYKITAGKLQSKFTRYTIPSLLKLPIGFAQAFLLIRKIKPEVILSFGGFASVPVVFAAWLMGIPIVIQEQIMGAGLANKISSKLASKIFVAREASLAFFPKDKTVVTGNPLTKEILGVGAKTECGKPATLYITGGSRGAQRINNQIFEILPELLPSYKVLHHTGELDFEKAKKVKAKLPTHLQKNYEMFNFVSPLKVHQNFEKADILVGRAGANTVSEAMAVGIPSIFIPIPWSTGDEQTKNALYAQNYGLGVILTEKEMTPATLVQKIDEVFKNWRSMARRFDGDRGASKKVVELLSDLLQS